MIDGWQRIIVSPGHVSSIQCIKLESFLSRCYLNHKYVAPPKTCTTMFQTIIFIWCVLLSPPYIFLSLSATKCLKVAYGSRSIWLTGNLRTPCIWFFHDFSSKKSFNCCGVKRKILGFAWIRILAWILGSRLMGFYFHIKEFTEQSECYEG